MYISNFSVTPANLCKRSDIEQLGMISMVHAKTSSHKHVPLSAIESMYLPAIQHRQVAIYHDEDLNPVGYLIWAIFSKQARQKYIAGKVLHLSEWNDGNELWILDFCALRGRLKYIRRSIRSLFSGKTVHYIRMSSGARRLISFELPQLIASGLSSTNPLCRCNTQRCLYYD